tara:strand:+ start:5307 stop:5939 length:633 start_codon:yes stop_codon:yes gene_type:complete
MDALDYASKRSKTFKEALELLRKLDYQLIPREVDEGKTLVNGFVRELDERNSCEAGGYYSPVPYIHFYRYSRRFDIYFPNSDVDRRTIVGYIELAFDSSPAKNRRGETWKEDQENNHSYGFYNDKYSISEYQAKRLYEASSKTEDITGARFKFVQGFITPTDDLDDLWDEGPYWERFTPSKFGRESAKRRGYLFKQADIVQRFQQLVEVS